MIFLNHYTYNTLHRNLKCNCIKYLLQDYISLTVPGVCMFKKRKRSIDSPIVRHRRQDMINPVVITFPNVTINQSIVTMISDTLLPDVMNVSLNSGKWLCVLKTEVLSQCIIMYFDYCYTGVICTWCLYLFFVQTCVNFVSLIGIFCSTFSLQDRISTTDTY